MKSAFRHHTSWVAALIAAAVVCLPVFLSPAHATAQRTITPYLAGTPLPGHPDFTGDGYEDVVSVNDSAVWLMSSTGSSFNAPVEWSSAPFYGNRMTLSGDFTGDGLRDMVAINNDSVWVMPSAGQVAGSPSEWSSVPFYGTRATLVADVNGDGKADLVAVNDDSVWVMLSTGTSFASPEEWSGSPFFGNVTTLAGAVSGHTISGHAVDDLVAVDQDSVWVMKSTGSAFGAPAEWSGTPFYGNVTTIAGDVTGDAYADLIAVDNSGVFVLPSAGTSFSAPQEWSSVPFFGTKATLAGDVNRDGVLDLVALNSGSAWVMRSTTTSFSAPENWWAQPFYGNKEMLSDTAAVPPLPYEGLFTKPQCGIPASVLRPGKLIVISLTCQELNAFQDGNLVMDTPVTTGRPALPTLPGWTQVYAKNHPFEMISPWPYGSPYWYAPSLVQYVTWFRAGGYGIHDAYWEPDSALGPGSENSGYASHGCVHVPLATAQQMYNWADIGTPVFVG
jgi:L,D-transpeptidase catalytic domain/FG-GAP-like repeat